MTDPVKYLSDWMMRYLKNRDLVFKKISGIEQKDDLLIIKEKSGSEITYYIEPFIKDAALILKRLAKDKSVGLVLFNTKENFDFVVKSWKSLVKIKSLSIYFINPFSKLDKKWILFPRTHAMVADEESLELGLKTMFETVDLTSEKELMKILTSD